MTRIYGNQDCLSLEDLEHRRERAQDAYLEWLDEKMALAAARRARRQAAGLLGDREARKGPVPRPLPEPTPTPVSPVGFVELGPRPPDLLMVSGEPRPRGHYHDQKGSTFLHARRNRWQPAGEQGPTARNGGAAMTTTMAHPIESTNEIRGSTSSDDTTAGSSQTAPVVFAPSQSERFRRAVLERLDEAFEGPRCMATRCLVARVLGRLPSRVARAFRVYERTGDLRDVAQRLGCDLGTASDLLERALEAVDDAIERASH